MASSDMCVILNFSNKRVLSSNLKTSKCYVEIMSPTKFKFFTNMYLNSRGKFSSKSSQIKGLSYFQILYDKEDEILSDYIKWIKFKNIDTVEEFDVIL